jgi:hypothetical protein
MHFYWAKRILVVCNLESGSEAGLAHAYDCASPCFGEAMDCDIRFSKNSLLVPGDGTLRRRVLAAPLPTKGHVSQN